MMKRTEWLKTSVEKGMGLKWIHVFVLYQRWPHISTAVFKRPVLKINTASRSFHEKPDDVVLCALYNYATVQLAPKHLYEKAAINREFEEIRRYVTNIFKDVRHYGLHQGKKVNFANRWFVVSQVIRYMWHYPRMWRKLHYLLF
jgi:hypothetical protein